MTLRALTAAALLASLTGCYSHVYHVRKTSHDHAEVAIDRIKPHSSVKWGTWWGIGPVWEPLGCFYADGSTHVVSDSEADENCKSYYALCENGVGRVEVQPVIYTLPISILTLGAFYAADVTAYCSAESNPDGPTGPDDPTGPDEEASGGDATVPTARMTGARTNGAGHARTVY
jgi:hypothetical protein